MSNPLMKSYTFKTKAGKYRTRQGATIVSILRRKAVVKNKELKDASDVTILNAWRNKANIVKEHG